MTSARDPSREITIRCGTPIEADAIAGPAFNSPPDRVHRWSDPSAAAVTTEAPSGLTPTAADAATPLAVATVAPEASYSVSWSAASETAPSERTSTAESSPAELFAAELFAPGS